MFTCDFVLHQTMINPSYNMQWYEIKKDSECYVLVPVPVRLELACQHRVRDILSRLNATVQESREINWGPDVGKEIIE